MKSYLIKNSSGEYLSQYGWGPMASAMRFGFADEAMDYAQAHHARNATIESLVFDDNRRPDIQTDYDPYGMKNT